MFGCCAMIEMSRYAAAALAPDTASRLIRVLGMLGSAHDGERAAAGLMAHRIIAGAGLTWETALAPLLGPPQADRGYEPSDDFVGHSDLVIFCIANSDTLSEWEISFLNSVLYYRMLTPKQRAVLARIVSKCEAASR